MNIISETQFMKNIIRFLFPNFSFSFFFIFFMNHPFLFPFLFQCPLFFIFYFRKKTWRCLSSLTSPSLSHSQTQQPEGERAAAQLQARSPTAAQRNGGHHSPASRSPLLSSLFQPHHRVQAPVILLGGRARR
jgi:hypothetical protein